MVTFLIILVGLVAFNIMLLKFSMHSVGSDKKKTKSKSKVNHISNPSTEKSENTEIPSAA